MGNSEQKIIVKDLHRTDREPLNYYPNGSFNIQWSSDGTQQISLTAIKDGSLAFQELQPENSLIWQGQEYVIKQCIPDFNGGLVTKQISATHVINEIQRTRQSAVKAGTLTYLPNDVLAFFFNGIVALGFTYWVDSGFESQQITDLGNFDGKEMLQKITDTWEDAVIIPDNKQIKVYKHDTLAKDLGNRIDYLANASDIKLTYDSTTLVNSVTAIGAQVEGSDENNPSYYFRPFVVKDDASIEQYGLHVGQDVSDERFHDKSSMQVYAKSQLQPQPILSIDVTNNERDEPQPYEIRRLEVREEGFVTNVEIVGYTFYPLDVNQPTQITLNNTSRTIMDYQNSVNARLSDNINDQRKAYLKLAGQLKDVQKDNWVAGSEYILLDENTEDYSVSTLNNLVGVGAKGYSLRVSNGLNQNNLTQAEKTSADSTTLKPTSYEHYFMGSEGEADVLIDTLNDMLIPFNSLITVEVSDDSLTTDEETLTAAITSFVKAVKKAGYSNLMIKTPADWVGTRFTTDVSLINVISIGDTKPANCNAWTYTNDFGQFGYTATKSYSKNIL